MEITNSYDLLLFLKEKDLLNDSPPYWWPNFGTFEVVVGAILTQNTRWDNVERSLKNIGSKDYSDDELLQFFINSSTHQLINLIAPSGFKNQKAARLKKLCQNISWEFGSFEDFALNASRQWLLEQKGIGNETADAILCYALGREEMVVDKYTDRLLKRHGYEFENYDEIKQWFEFGINENYDRITTLYGYKISLNEVYSRFHGKIVEFMKKSR